MPEQPSQIVSSLVEPDREGNSKDLAQVALNDGLLERRRLLDEESIFALGSQFRDALHPTESRLAYARMLEGMTIENARLIREQLSHLDERSPEFREFHYAWGEIAGREAVLHGVETPKRDVSVTLAGWARADSEGAMAWVASVEDDDRFNQADLEYGIAHGLALTDPKAAGDYVMAKAESGDPAHVEKMLGLVTGKLLQAHGPADTAAWAEEFDEGSPSRGQAMRQVFRQWAKGDPQSASARLAEMPLSQDRDDAINGFVSQLIWGDPVSAMTWAGEINDPQTQERVLARTAQTFITNQPQAYKEWLDNSGLSGEARASILKISPRW